MTAKKKAPQRPRKAPAPVPHAQAPPEEIPAAIAVQAAPPSNLPFPRLSEEEKRLIRTLARYRESFSHEDIARKLNEIFREYNHGCRTRKGVEKFLAKPIDDEGVNDGAMQPAKTAA